MQVYFCPKLACPLACSLSLTKYNSAGEPFAWPFWKMLSCGWLPGFRKHIFSDLPSKELPEFIQPNLGGQTTVIKTQDVICMQVEGGVSNLGFLNRIHLTFFINFPSLISMSFQYLICLRSVCPILFQIHPETLQCLDWFIASKSKRASVGVFPMHYCQKSALCPRSLAATAVVWNPWFVV